MKKPNIYKRDQSCVNRMLPSDPTGSLDEFFLINYLNLNRRILLWKRH